MFGKINIFKDSRIGKCEGTTIVQDDPRLYVIMRDDLKSLNAGKAVAQGIHAGNALESYPKRPDDEQLFQEWKSQTLQGFGTTIVLSGGIEAIRMVVERAKSQHMIADVIHDPTYPIADGADFHLVPKDTCGYVFGKTNDVRLITDRFSLALMK